ncbi:MAG: matrixin family metalloprotease, partial [Thaumarchaeota archaeon]|nr:matrixin family metalloprotease [Nitrososphaerota archaeon]
MAAVVRHEVGHALGPAHATAPEDLMALTMT